MTGYLQEFGNHYTRTYSMEIDGISRQLTLEYRYVPLFDYWRLSIYDTPTGEMVVANLPLLYNEGEGQNVLRQFDYLDIGSCYVYKAVEEPKTQWPTGESFGVEYMLAWGDRVG